MYVTYTVALYSVLVFKLPPTVQELPSEPGASSSVSRQSQRHTKVWLVSCSHIHVHVHMYMYHNIHVHNVHVHTHFTVYFTLVYLIILYKYELYMYM